MKKIIMLILLSGILSGNDDSLLHVNGTGKVYIKATLATVRLGIEVEGKSSQDTQNELSLKLNRLIETIKKTNPLKLETSLFSTYPEYTDDKPPQIKSYRGHAELLITVLSESVGNVVELSLENGANKINGIELKGSDEAINEARSAAIRQAAFNAMKAAEVTLDALHLQLDEIVDVNLSPIEPMPRPFRTGVAFSAMSKSSQGPEVEGEQAVQTDVALKIRFKSKRE